MRNASWSVFIGICALQFLLLAGALPPTPSPPERTIDVIGKSVQGREIRAIWFGQGERWVAVVGGIHGGYEWNTIELAFQMRNYWHMNPGALPKGMRIALVIEANPDMAGTIQGRGRLAQDPKMTGWSKRLNANGVDLNRNWPCSWQPQGRWREQVVAAGAKPFSEPETQALRDLLERPGLAAVIFWHSAGGMTLAGECGESRKAVEAAEEAEALARAYAQASGYVFQSNFSAYPVQGAAIDWLVGQGIPAIDVELRNHRDTDWERNLKGMQALLEQLSR